MKNDLDDGVFAYIATLEKNNDELAKALKHCVFHATHTCPWIDFLLDNLSGSL
jgi:hypothetical protein